jgi:hypothetical protein
MFNALCLMLTSWICSTAKWHTRLKSGKITQSINMNMKEVWIKTQDPEANIPVTLSYNPFEQKDFEVLKSKRMGPLDYFFIAKINQIGNIKTVIGNPRNHNEFRLAIEQDIGKIDSWRRGQFYLDMENRISGMSILFPSSMSEERRIREINFLLEDIDFQFFCSEWVDVQCGLRDKYHYNSSLKNRQGR